MTPLQSNLMNVSPPLLACQSLRVCWTSQTSSGLRTLWLSVDMDSPQHAAVEAWVEQAGQRTCVLQKQRRRIGAFSDDRLRHLEVLGDNGDGPIAAITLLCETHGDRVLYARTTLLANAGFAAGSYDPPTLKR